LGIISTIIIIISIGVHHGLVRDVSANIGASVVPPLGVIGLTYPKISLRPPVMQLPMLLGAETSFDDDIVVTFELCQWF
jgi:hypothetical protein